MRLLTFALLALLSVPTFAQTNEGGWLPTAAPTIGFDVEDVTLHEGAGGYIDRADGSVTVLTTLDPGTPVFVTVLGDDGVPIMPMVTLMTEMNGTVSFGGNNDGIGVLPLIDNDGDWGLPFVMDILDPDADDGFATLLSGTLTSSNDPIGDLPTYAAGDGDGGLDLPTIGGAGMGQSGDGGGNVFATGKCNKAKCRLTVHYNDGSNPLSIELDKDDTYHIPWGTNVALITCACD